MIYLYLSTVPLVENKNVTSQNIPFVGLVAIGVIHSLVPAKAKDIPSNNVP